MLAASRPNPPGAFGGLDPAARRTPKVYIAAKARYRRGRSVTLPRATQFSLVGKSGAGQRYPKNVKKNVKNAFGKKAKLDNPHMVWKSVDGSWEWRVLKTYQTPEEEEGNHFALWFCAVKSPMTFGTFDLGNVYVAEIKRLAVQVK